MDDFDTLTGIPRSATFQTCLTNAISDARATDTPLAVFYIGIDHMKHFNMHNGYQAGDTTLQRMVGLISSLRENQLALFRMGGDIFSLILPNIGQAEAVTFAQHICEHVRENLAPPQPLHCGETQCLGPAKLAVSIGVALLDNTMDTEQMMQIAEKAVANAKQAGGDQVWI